MTTTEKKKLVKLEKEVAKLHSFIFGVAGRDTEGDYNPEIAKQVLRASFSKPAGTITSGRAFVKKFL